MRMWCNSIRSSESRAAVSCRRIAFTVTIDVLSGFRGRSDSLINSSILVGVHQTGSHFPCGVERLDYPECMRHGGKRDGSGRKKGSAGIPWKRTLEKQAAHDLYRQQVLDRMEPLVRAQVEAALGSF